MIKYLGKNFYSAREITRLINETGNNLHNAWYKSFGMDIVTVSHVTRILTKAKNNQFLKFITYKKKGKRQYYAFSQEDIINFLSEKIDEFYLLDKSNIKYNN